MSITLFLSMLSFAFVLSISPGPVNIMILSSSINYGFKKTFSFISGATIGFTILLAIIAFGFESVLTKSKYLTNIMEVFGACFILFIGYKILTSNKFGNSSFNLYVFVILYFVVCYICLSFWGVVGNKLTKFFNSQFKLKIFNIVMGMLLIMIAFYVLGTKIFS